MSQKLTNGKYVFDAKIEHNKIFSMDVPEARILTDVDIYASLESPVLMGRIKNLHVESE